MAGQSGPLPRLALVALAVVGLTGYTPAIGAGRWAAGCVTGTVRTAAEAEPEASAVEKAAAVAEVNRSQTLAVEAARQRATVPLAVHADRTAAEAYVAGLRQADSVLRRDWYCRGGDRTRAALDLASHYRFGWAPFAVDVRRAWLWFGVAAAEGSAPAARQQADLERGMSAVERTDAGWMLAAWRADPPTCQSSPGSDRHAGTGLNRP